MPKNKVKKKPGRKPKKKPYFGLDVQDAIVRYNQSESNSDRNKYIKMKYIKLLIN